MANYERFGATLNSFLLLYCTISIAFTQSVNWIVTIKSSTRQVGHNLPRDRMRERERERESRI